MAVEAFKKSKKAVKSAHQNLGGVAKKLKAKDDSPNKKIEKKNKVSLKKKKLIQNILVEEKKDSPVKKIKKTKKVLDKMEHDKSPKKNKQSKNTVVKEQKGKEEKIKVKGKEKAPVIKVLSDVIVNPPHLNNLTSQIKASIKNKEKSLKLKKSEEPVLKENGPGLQDKSVVLEKKLKKKKDSAVVETNEVKPQVSKNLKKNKQKSVPKENSNNKVLKRKSSSEEVPVKSKKNKVVKEESEVDAKKSKIQKKNLQKKINVKKPEIKSIKSKKRKLSASEQEQEPEPESDEIISPNLVRKDVAEYVKALLKISADEQKEKKSLFDSEKPPVLLYISAIKIPKAPTHQLRIQLPHSLVLPDDDVALFVRDMRRGRRFDHENTITHYQELLRKHGVTRIKTVIPMNQVKTEYSQYEMRLKLLGSYDHFLVDGRIAGHLFHKLGKKFKIKRKMPTSIHMESENLKKEIDKALHKTCLLIHGNGDGSCTQIGNCSMSVDEITDNIIAVAESLNEHFPGGWANIRQLGIKTPTSLQIPVYITLKCKNQVKVPVQAPKRPKAYKTVEGELSTFKANVKAIVAPDGTVDVQKIDDGSDDEEEDNENEDVDDDINEFLK